MGGQCPLLPPLGDATEYSFMTNIFRLLLGTCQTSHYFDFICLISFPVLGSSCSKCSKITRHCTTFCLRVIISLIHLAFQGSSHTFRSFELHYWTFPHSAGYFIFNVIFSRQILFSRFAISFYYSTYYWRKVFRKDRVKNGSLNTIFFE